MKSIPNTTRINSFICGSSASNTKADAGSVSLWKTAETASRGNTGKRFFEPFFSSKPKELGTGLGLSISFGIVQDHHGNIRYETAEGIYTKFIVELPVDNGWLLNGPSDTDKEVIS